VPGIMQFTAVKEESAGVIFRV